MADSTRKNMPQRLLRLLSLLQSRRTRSGAELAERLGVSHRTLRRDVERLRGLDYPVHAATGTAGGYRLHGAAGGLPPLLLDDEEAVATAVALATAPAQGAPDTAEAAAGALAKLEQMLPARLRPRLAALGRAASALPHGNAPPLDTALLAVLAACCRDREVVAFDYRTRSGGQARRRAEPHHLVTAQGRWYLIAYDRDRADWRTFRLDRIGDVTPARRRFSARELPAADPAAFLARSFARAEYRHSVLLEVGLGAERLRERLFASVPGEVTARGPHRCGVRLSAEEPELVVQFVAAIAALEVDFALMGAPAEITRRLGALSRRLSP